MVRVPSGVLLLASALCLVVPSAGASWGSPGSIEPDSLWDETQGFMFSNPPPAPLHGEPGDRVYFNGLVEPYGALGPNLGLVQSRWLVPGPLRAMAFLGVWSDCDGDGYLGSAMSGLLEYRSETLLDASRCPVRGPHNDGQWVREFRWIGPALNAEDPFGITPGLIDDPGALVWADLAAPDGHDPSGMCSAEPPTGTFSTTGGLLAFADCHGRRGVVTAFNDAAGVADPANSLGLRFDDAERPQCTQSSANVWIGTFRDSPACPHGTGFLEAHSHDPAFGISRCSYVTVLVDPFGPDVYVPSPDPWVGNAHGSLVDSALIAASPTSSGCGGEDATATNVYDMATPERQGVSVDAKRSTSFWMEFTNDASGGVPRRAADVELPPNGGLSALDRVGATPQGPLWVSQNTVVPAVPLREDLHGDSAIAVTFYGSISPDASNNAQVGHALRTSSSSRPYGAEWCGGFTSGVHHGWDCASVTWWNEALGAPARPRTTWSQRSIGAAPGQGYQLRDVDCFDEGAGPGPGVGILDAPLGCPGT